MAKRMLVGALMILAGLGLLTPPAWALFSPFLFEVFSSSGSAAVSWLAATLAGFALLFFGVRRVVTGPG
jgi:hypothetical protein